VCERIIEDDLVSINGEPFRPVGDVPELAKHLSSTTRTDRRHDLGPPDLRGLLAASPAAGIFLDMYLDRRTGLVIFDCHEVRKDVYVEKGWPRFVSSNVASELLGEYLVRAGTISRMELDMALAVMDRWEGRLGDTLIGLDIVDSITLLRDITLQIKDRLYDLYTWKGGEYQFYGNAGPVKEEFRLAVHPLELIKEGCLRALDAEDLEGWFGEQRSSILAVAPSPRVPIEGWRFSPSYEIVLADLAQKRSLAEIMQPYAHASTEVRRKIIRVLRFGTMVGIVEILRP
jgi:hypothetical protein